MCIIVHRAQEVSDWSVNIVRRHRRHNLAITRMTKKRESSATTVSSLQEPSDIFTLSDDQSVTFWGSVDSINIAKSAIEQRLYSIKNIANHLNILATVGSYVIKVYSSAINASVKHDDSCLVKIFAELRSTFPPSGVCLVKKYLTCCLSCCSNFPNSLRRMLIQTLAARSLQPSTALVLTSKVGIVLMIDWLKELLALSNDVSTHIVGLLLLFLDQKGAINRQVSDSAIHSLIEFSVISELKPPGILWKELWNNVGVNPSTNGKKQALSLLQYSIAIYQLNSSKGFDQTKSAQMATSIPTGRKKGAGFVQSKMSLRLHDICKNIHCPELFPLVIICHSGHDIISTSAVLHLLASSAHHSITAGISYFNSQRPTAVWTAVLKACVECLKLVGSAAIANKVSQHKVLTILNQVLSSNPFEREFKLKCTAKQSIAIIAAEIKMLKSVSKSSTDSLVQDYTDEKGVRAETDDAIEFLTQESMFVETIQSKCFALVMDILLKGRQREISTRTMAVIASILQSSCCGADPVAIMSCLETDLPQDINDFVINLIRSRCIHEDSFLEIASEVMEKSESAEHFLLSQEYVQLTKLSSLCQHSTATVGYKDADAIGLSLLNKLALLVKAQKSSIIDDSYGDGLLHNRKLQVILLALSVLTVNTNAHGNIIDAYRNKANYLLDSFLEKLEDLRIDILRGSKSAALHCTIWLLLLSQMCKNCSSRLSNDSDSMLLTDIVVDKMTYMIYPDLLINSYIMPAAVAFAMHLRDPQRLLFESIGYLQDVVFNLEVTLIVDFVHYAHLIATTVIEISKIVREVARARVIAVDDKYRDESKLCSLLPPDEIISGSRMDVGISLSSYSLKVAPVQPGNELDVDYMSAAYLQERVDEAVINDLEDSINSEKSFLGCFLPLFSEMLISNDIAESIRIGALRTINAFIKSSKTVLMNHIDIVETMITHPAGLWNDVSCKYHYNLQTEALLVWVETFNLTVMGLITPVRAILNCLQSFMTSKVSLRDNTTIERDGDPENDKGCNNLYDFAIAILQGMHCLITNNKLKDPTEYAVAISVPFAFDATGCDRRCKAIQEESRIILRGLFLNYPKLLTRTLYQLCLTPQTSRRSCTTESAAPNTEIIDLLQCTIGEKDRLRVVDEIIKIVQNEEFLIHKLNEIDRALTEESIRCNNTFAAAALQYLDVTSESRKAICDAAALGVLDTLEPLISKRLNARLNSS